MQKLHCVSLTKTLTSEMAREFHIGAIALEVEGILAKTLCLGPNELDGSSIGVSDCSYGEF